MKVRKNLAEIKNKGLSIRRQCELLSINRGVLYYKPKGESLLNLELMRVMDPHLLAYPTEGVQSLVYFLEDQGYTVNPKRIRRLFKVMGHQTQYRMRNLTKQGLAKYIKPYLLRNLKITRANQVWCTDITYIPMKNGFMYLTAIIDVYSRKILSWGLSNSMTKDWCIAVLQEAIEIYGKPEILNSDQGSQYTSKKWIEALQSQEIKISMDGKGRATDNTWIERFWKTIKTNYIYLNPENNGLDLYRGIQKYIGYYNLKTHHTTKQKPSLRYTESTLKTAA
jgi:putative transposase